MKLPRYLLIASLLASTGCSSLMAVSGVDPFVNDRDEARQRFGQPIATGTDSDGSYDIFRTHLPIADGMRFSANGMSYGALLAGRDSHWDGGNHVRSARSPLSDGVDWIALHT